MAKKIDSISDCLDFLSKIGEERPEMVKKLLKGEKVRVRVQKKVGTSENGWYFLSGPGKRVVHYTQLRDMFARYFERYGTYPNGCGNILKRFMRGIENDVTTTELAKLEKNGLFEFYSAGRGEIDSI